MCILDHQGTLSDTEGNLLQAHITPQIENSIGFVAGEILPDQPAEGEGKIT
jgi:hypothetical protein